MFGFANPWILLAIAAAFAATAASGFWAGKEWEQGAEAQRQAEAQVARETDAKQQRQFNDQVAGRHAATLANLNRQLGDARERIAQLPGRACLDAGTVGLLNDINVPARSGAAASEPARPAETASSGGGLRFSTDRDVGSALAICRTAYAEVANQVNQILDIEDRRYPLGSN